MTELETAIAGARELENRVKQLYFHASRCDSGLVTLKLLFPGITLPVKGVREYRGDLAVAIARAVTLGDTNSEWCVWLKRKKNNKGNFMFRFRWFGSHMMPDYEKIPWSWNHGHYFIHPNTEELPF